MGEAQPATGEVKSASAWPVAAPFRTGIPSLASLIEAEFSGAQLRDLARWLGATPKGYSRVKWVEQVVAALNDRIARAAESPDALLEGLSAEQQEFVRRLLTARDHEVPIARGMAADLWARAAERSSDSRLDADRRLTELIESLRRCALLFPTRAAVLTGLRDVYYRWLPLNGARIPVMRWPIQAESAVRVDDSSASPVANILEHFEIFLNAIARSGATLRTPLPAHRQAAWLPWLRDWEHDANEAERVLRSRPNWAPDPHTGISVLMFSPLAPESAATLEDQTGLTTPQIEFLFAIACALQLIEPPDGALRVRARNSALEEWLVLADAHKLRRAWTAWSEQILDGLEVRNAISNLKSAQRFRVMRAIGARHLTPGVLAAEWCALRRYMVRVLRGLPVNQWVRWDDLQARLFDFHPECVWTFTTKADWWFVLAATGARMNLKQAEEWRASVGVILEHIIRDSLAWFGAVEVRHTPEGRLDAFKVTPLGEWLIEGRQDALPAEAAPKLRSVAPIEWLDGHTLRLPPAPDRAALVSLVRRCAEATDAPFTYVFTQGSIERALSEGLSLAEVAAQFKSADASLSPAVGELFGQIAQRHGRVRVYESLAVLELADEFAVKELAASTSLMKHVVYQLSSRAFVLHEDDLETLIEELREKGYMPRVR
ncbi:MAG: helicase-associated domain-containing protein [Thermoflexales bacterium]|nr:helicase-associated domain-containing protein [Thermoflexales bacterium]MDW8350540.1 helicase-associated domain-containing protein [Anaerolineae bacterium]